MSHYRQRATEMASRSVASVQRCIDLAKAWVAVTWRRHVQRLLEDSTYRSAVMAGVAAVLSAVYRTAPRRKRSPDSWTTYSRPEG